jgi:hypothetical protein
MVDTINSRRYFFFFPTCWALLFLLLVLPRNTNTQHKHHRPLHVKQYCPCRSETTLKFCSSNTRIIPWTVTLFATLNWSGSVSAEGDVGRLFVPPSWVSETSGSKRQCVQRALKSLRYLIHVPAVFCTEGLSSTLLCCQSICFPFCTIRLASRFMTDDEVQYYLDRVLPSVCVQKLEHSERFVMIYYVRQLNWSFSKRSSFGSDLTRVIDTLHGVRLSTILQAELFEFKR